MNININIYICLALATFGAIMGAEYNSQNRVNTDSSLEGTDTNMNCTEGSAEELTGPNNSQRKQFELPWALSYLREEVHLLLFAARCTSVGELFKQFASASCKLEGCLQSNKSSDGFCRG